MTSGDQIREAAKRLSARARAYCLATSVRHLALGTIALTQADQFSESLSFRTIQALGGLGPENAMRFWGVLFAIVGSVLLGAAISGRDQVARWGLFASVVLTSVWGGAFVATALHPPNDLNWAVPTVWAITWITLTVKDATMLRSPLANPFEHAAGEVVTSTNKEAIETTREAVAVSEKATETARVDGER